MRINKYTDDNYTIRQLKLPLEIEKLIDISDPVYTFCEVMDHIDLSKYFVEKGYKTGRPRCDEQKLLKVILFAFMEHAISSLRGIEKLCRNDICTKNRDKVFEKISLLIDAMNQDVLGYSGVKLEKRQEYAIEYICELLSMYKAATNLDEATYISGCGHRKNIQQKQYQE